MRKVPPPSPCTVYVPDPDAEDGFVVAEVVTTHVKRARSDWEPDEVTKTLRIMAEQETGEVMFVCYATSGSAQRLIDEHMESHPEHRQAWAERL